MSKQKRRCAGYPPHDDCPNPAGTPWTPYWCERCDKLRRAEITASLERMAAKMGAVSEELNPEVKWTPPTTDAELKEMLENDLVCPRCGAAYFETIQTARFRQTVSSGEWGDWHASEVFDQATESAKCGECGFLIYWRLS